MTISVAQGTISISSTLSVGSTIDVTTDGAGAALTGFHTAAKRAVIFKWLGRSSTGESSGNNKWGTGFATSTTSRRSYATVDSNGANPTRCKNRWRNDAAICILVSTSGSTGNIEGLVDYNGEVTNGYQLIIDDQLTTTELVGWKAIWGDELEHAMHDFTSPGITGNVDYDCGLALNTGLDNKALFIIGGANVAVDTIGANSNHMLGVAAGNTPSNAVLLTAADDAASTSATWSYCRSGECIANSTAVDAIAERAAVTQWNANGWRKNWTEVNGTAGLFRYSALALKGPRCAVFDILSRTDTTQTDEVVGFDPLGLVLASHSRTQSSSDTTQAHAIASVGFATGASSRSAFAFEGIDAVSPSNFSGSIRTDCAYTSLSGGVEDALLDIVDFNASGGGFTFVQDDPEPSASFIWGLAIGLGLGATTVSAPTRSHTYNAPQPGISIGLVSVMAPSVAHSYAPRLPLSSAPLAAETIEQFLDKPNVERTWLVELEAFPLAPLTQPTEASDGFSETAYAETAYSEGEATEEGSTVTLHYSDRGYTSVSFSPQQGVALDLPGSEDHLSVCQLGFDFIQDKQIGDLPLALSRAGNSATRRNLTPRRYVSLPGSTGSTPWTTDASANSITGDIRIEMEIAAARYSGVTQTGPAKWGAAGQRSYKLSITSGAFVQLTWSPDGSTAVSATSTIPLTAVNGALIWVAGWLDVNNGLNNWTAGFEVSTDGVVWSALGATVSGEEGEPTPATSVGVGAYFVRPPESTEANYVNNFFGGRTPDLNADFLWGGNGTSGENENWTFLTSANQINGNLDKWGAWLASRPTRRADFALGLCPWIGSSFSNTGALLSEVAAGTHNSKFTTWANSMKNFGLGGSASRPIYIRLGWEMGGTWFPWGARPGTAGNAHYKGAWQQVVPTIRAVNPHMKFVFCPEDHAYRPGSLGIDFLDSIWPGNSLVDLIGIDIYDRGSGDYPPANSTTRQTSWNDFHLVALTEMNAFATAKGKRQCIGEWSCASIIDGGVNVGGTDNPFFIQKIYDWITSHNDTSTGFEYAVQFNNDPSSAELENLSNFPNARALYTQLFGSLPHPW